MPSRTKKKGAAIRREPRQARAQATIQCILEATAQVLVERGYAGASTNHIAERAGIGIGSFYQYFADKDEAIQLLLEHHLAEAEETVTSALAAADRNSLEEIVKQSVEGSFVFYRDNFHLCEVFHNQLPKAPSFDLLGQHYRRLAKLIESFLLLHSRKLRPMNASLASEMIVHAMIGVFFGVDPSWKKQEGIFLQELQSLMVAYLLGDA